MIDHLLTAPTADTVRLTLLTKAGLDTWTAGANPAEAAWVKRLGFKAAPGATAILPGTEGQIARVLVGVADRLDIWSLAGLPGSLPAGSYVIDADLDAETATAVATGWVLATYQFTRYKRSNKEFASLVLPANADGAAVVRFAKAAFMVRDLVNTPCEDMGPAHLADAAEQLAAEFGATFTAIVGDDLLTQNYPMIHAVGRAAARAPRLIELRWGEASNPLVTLVGKGVCFDTGGLDIKPSAGMLLMKKDMGGAAHALGLARMIMAANLPVRLRVLVPAVENAIAGNAFRPMDILPTRKGLTVEIGNTDAEGRLILCDALAEADSEKPALLLDFATLTGAARVALGPDLPALFSNNDGLAAEILAAGIAKDDPLWRLPLWQGYRAQLDSKIADLNNAPGGGMAGAITAALYLEQFVSKDTVWAHVDLFSWNQSNRPGRPEGGEAMTLRAMFEVVATRFGSKQ
ncbi:leucyl aminopeptidase [Niveispirillum lacus]|uniref:Leucyl aminopeptidase n=1 Tax=Niveispirillum lacus TaxID=1981099 RepID=A0A255Z107_9PROT|nr:leucyl aminopeptidase family protein [Niveispirillum lacus]OYQ34624.1 leucyl aminopeptidase [Niveispirillum lacus]